MQFAVLGLPIKKTDKGDILIMMQLRRVKNSSYDPLYDNTWEGISETVRPGEDVIEALKRGFREECGLDAFRPVRIMGANRKVWTTGKKDRFHCHEPFCFVQSLGPPQPWICPVFVVEVRKSFQPNYKIGDGEAVLNRWWTAEELKKQIESEPQIIMGLDLPAFYKLCLAILGGEIS